eukprot:TRINITY_DN7661_c0_g1_i2.p1 TRINITY_DN7661_c0_g1~~TRINITY_DN7661_c0_g1_i2.p1  ORF type:complete len:124 (-),score=56.34 TRINITY_DN7661_c0_g1_i2:62-433(-)
MGEIGKISQVTPLIISKGLEIFLTELIQKAAALAKAGKSAKLTGYHLKKAVEMEEKYKFVEKVVKDIPEPDEDGQKKRRGKKAKGEKAEAPSSKEKKPRKRVKVNEEELEDEDVGDDLSLIHI